MAIPVVRWLSLRKIMYRSNHPAAWPYLSRNSTRAVSRVAARTKFRSLSANVIKASKLRANPSNSLTRADSCILNLSICSLARSGIFGSHVQVQLLHTGISRQRRHIKFLLCSHRIKLAVGLRHRFPLWYDPLTTYVTVIIRIYRLSYCFSDRV